MVVNLEMILYDSYLCKALNRYDICTKYVAITLKIEKERHGF
jgi:hypothetical protein